jgi:hypothetical protein
MILRHEALEPFCIEVTDIGNYLVCEECSGVRELIALKPSVESATELAVTLRVRRTATAKTIADFREQRGMLEYKVNWNSKEDERN